MTWRTAFEAITNEVVFSRYEPGTASWGMTNECLTEGQRFARLADKADTTGLPLTARAYREEARRWRWLAHEDDPEMNGR